MIEGRFLTAQDGKPETLGVVVNAAMSNTFWPHQPAIGRRIRLGGSKDPWYRLVGVISDIKNGGLEKPAGTELFISYRAPDSERYEYYVALRSASDPRLAAGEIRRIVSTLVRVCPSPRCERWRIW